MSDLPEVLELHEVTRSFGKTVAVAGVSLTLQARQSTALLGLNGAGKSTLMRLITGYLPPDSGQISICGLSLDSAPAKARANLGYLPENAPFFHHMRVREALDFAAEIHGINGEARKRAVERAVHLCELENVLPRLCQQLSKGYRHRLGLATALIHRPQLLVLDEPTDGLDPLQKEAARGMIRKIADECAVLISTHILDEVPGMCSRVLIMSGGRITFDGDVPEDLQAVFTAAAAPDAATPRERTP